MGDFSRTPFESPSWRSCPTHCIYLLESRHTKHHERMYVRTTITLQSKAPCHPTTDACVRLLRLPSLFVRWYVHIYREKMHINLTTGWGAAAAKFIHETM